MPVYAFQTSCIAQSPSGLKAIERMNVWKSAACSRAIAKLLSISSYLFTSPSNNEKAAEKSVVAGSVLGFAPFSCSEGLQTSSDHPAPNHWLDRRRSDVAAIQYDEYSTATLRVDAAEIYLALVIRRAGHCSLHLLASQSLDLSKEFEAPGDGTSAPCCCTQQDDG